MHLVYMSMQGAESARVRVGGWIGDGVKNYSAFSIYETVYKA
jgi:hypothetical protein